MNTISVLMLAMPAMATDTWARSQVLAGDGVLGNSIAVDGNTAIIGGRAAAGGAVYVFVKTGGSWILQQKLTTSESMLQDVFGAAVAVSGDTAVIGAPHPGGGAAYVFVRNGNLWSRQQKLTHPADASGIFFGGSVAVSGNTAFVSASPAGLFGSSSVSIFTRQGSDWNFLQRITSTEQAFGQSIAISGDTAVITATGQNALGQNAPGSAYIFARDSSGWTQVQKLAGEGPNFGIAAALSGNTVVITGFTETYVFVRQGNTWSLQQRLIVRGTVAAIEDNTLVVGNPGTSAGEANVYTRSGTTWTLQQQLTSGGTLDYFGFSVGITGGTILVGAPLSVISHPNPQVTYVFTKVAGTQSAPLRFVPITPCRVMETRSPYNFEGRTGSFGPPALARDEVRTLNLPQSNVCSIPATAKAYVLNVATIPGSAGLGHARVWPAGDPQPNVWTIRSPDGQVVANSQIVRAGTNGGISVYVSDATDMLIDISGYYTDSASVAGLAFYPMTPCRVIETRNVYRPQPGPFGPPAMSGGQTRRFTLPQTPYCTIPQATAYSVTITATPPGPLAYLTAWPDGTTQPNISSINSFAGRVLANSLIIPASANGTIDVFAFNTTDLIMDINGYYAPDDGQRGLFYYPVTQCRAYDSTTGSAFPDQTARTISIPTAAGCVGIPANAQGYAINVTALPNGSPMPFLTAYPTGQPRPDASILNAFQGQVVTNSAIVPAGWNGAIDVYAFRRTDVVVEVSGYFGR